MIKGKFIMPNHIVIKDGLACGDRVTLLYDFDKDMMNFNMISNGCKCCEEMCTHLQRIASGKSGEDIVSICNSIEKKLKNGAQNEAISETINYQRLNCYMAPVLILKECASDLREHSDISCDRVNLYVDKLDCDACATRENVSWLYQKPRHIHGKYEISAENRKMLMRLGRIEADDIKYEQAIELYKNLGKDEFEFMEEYKLMPMVYQNLKKINALDLHDDRWRLLVYQYQRTAMADGEIRKINQYISENQLKAYWVKGAYTKDLYVDKKMRNLTDFDLLVLDENDAFQIIGWLLENDFNIFPDSFSLKKSVQGEEIKYTGHLHFQKVINLQYRLIIDVNFTGFPMIKVASYVPKITENGIAAESMIVVTLCHLFKHKEVFLKDINDIFIMLSRNEYNVDTLKSEMKKNGLEDLFSVVLRYIKQEYSLPNKTNQIYEVFKEYDAIMNTIDFRDWPYDRDDVSRIKTYYFEKFIKEKVDTQRIYLYPTIILKNKKDANKIIEEIKLKSTESEMYQINKLTNLIYQVIVDDLYFVITPVGIFLEMKEHYVENMKAEIRKKLMNMIAPFDIDIMEIPYAIAFEEKWLDN